MQKGVIFVPTKSIKRILFDNFFTLFNLLNLILGIAIFAVGSYKNLLFLGVVVINTAISTIQEIHSKRVIDKLSLLATTKAKVIKNGEACNVPINELTVGDLVELNTGNQIVADSVITDGEVEVSEAFITGEPDSVTKKEGDKILSGSFVVSGKCICEVEHVGEENFAEQISNKAKYVKKVNSEIINALNKIVEILSVIIIPIGVAFFVSQLNVDGNTFQEAVVKTVAAIIGMIPEGLVLLTTTVLAVSVIRLAKTKVLVQELYCIETLARVDTLCLDKTGTLTEAAMEVKDCMPAKREGKKEFENILANFGLASQDENTTIDAIRKKYRKPKTKFTPINHVPFSSQTKWSSVEFENEGEYIIGAPEIVLGKSYKEYKTLIEGYSKDYRVIVVAKTVKPVNETVVSKTSAKIKSLETVESAKSTVERHALPSKVEFVGIVLILDKIRKEAASTIKYFYKQGVDIKIISGDNPTTVSKIAKQVGIRDYQKYIDMSTVGEPDAQNAEHINLNVETDTANVKHTQSATGTATQNAETTLYSEIVEKYTIFGRVSPTQKEGIIKALQEKGRTVAMTGDGVNDVLALKASDCSVAMANGSDATKAVSQLVLLDSNFASMPKVVAEGRRTINNIQRSSTLFLVKTIYSTLLILILLLLHEEYPFTPIQLSLIGVITIGIPSFILALEPNRERIKGKFLQNVIAKAFPTGLAVVINILTISVLNKLEIISDELASTLSIISTGVTGIALLFTLAKTRKGEESKYPVSIFRLSLAMILTLIFVICITAFNGFFGIEPLQTLGIEAIGATLLAISTFGILNLLMSKK